MKKLHTVKELFQASKDLITDVGWCKGEYVKYQAGTNNIVGYCLLGALLNACTGSDPDLYSIATDLIQERLHDKVGHTYIPQYNDADSTKKEDVLSLLSDMIKEEDKREQG